MTPTPSPQPGYFSTLRAALNAGALAGLVWGLVDGVVALGRMPFGISWTHALGCLAAGVLVYGGLHCAGQLLLSLAAHRFLRERTPGARLRILFGLGLGFGLALELYWWTRPWVFYGQAFSSPGRLAAAAGSLVLGLALGWVGARLYARFAGQKLQLALRALVPLAWIAGGLYLAAQGGAADRSERGRLNERNRDLPNVLLIVVDALRQDTLGCYGHPTVETPVIDGLAERGVRFDNAFVQAPFTLSSFGSWLTGKYPRRHGLVKMVTGITAENMTLAAHLEQAPFLPGNEKPGEGGERLWPDDYFDAYFLTGMMSHGSGLIRGADVYCEAVAGHGLVDREVPWSVFSSELLVSILRTRVQEQSSNYALAAQLAEQWIDANGDRRFAALVHLYSTHTPYNPPDVYRGPYVDPDYAGPIDPGFFAHHRYAIEAGEYPVTPEQFEQWPADKQHIQDLYLAGVAQADADIGRILAALERKGVLDDTLVILTSDHGEDLGEGEGVHERWEHNHMYETNLRVPWILSWPNGLAQGAVVDARVDSIDLVPTVSDLLGIAVPDESESEGEYGRVDGVSLLPLIRGDADEVRPYGFSENGRFLSISDGAHKLVVALDQLDPEVWEQAVAGAATPPPRLFDLQSDPYEQANRWGDPELDEVRDRLVEELRLYDARMPIARNQIVRSHRDEESENLLNNLGYAGEFDEDEDAQGSEEAPTPEDAQDS